MQIIVQRLSSEKSCTIESIIAENYLCEEQNNYDNILTAYTSFINTMKDNSPDEYLILCKSTLDRYATEEGFTKTTFGAVLGITIDKSRGMINRYNEKGV